MTVADITSFLLSLVPYLNAGTVTLIISLGFDRLGFKITKREFKKKPLENLLRGLCLLLLSGFVTVLIHARLVGLEPLLVFIVLLAVYLALTQT